MLLAVRLPSPTHSLRRVLTSRRSAVGLCCGGVGARCCHCLPATEGDGGGRVQSTGCQRRGDADGGGGDVAVLGPRRRHAERCHRVHCHSCRPALHRVLPGAPESVAFGRARPASLGVTVRLTVCPARLSWGSDADCSALTVNSHPAYRCRLWRTLLRRYCEERRARTPLLWVRCSGCGHARSPTMPCPALSGRGRGAVTTHGGVSAGVRCLS